MAYQSWSVVFGEQPSASKWGILGTNDASFNDGTGITGLYKNLLTVDSNPYKFMVRLTSGSPATGNNAFGSAVAFNSEDYDTNNNVSSGVYTAPVAGFYYFSWACNVGTSASGQGTTSAVYKNGVRNSDCSWSYSSATGQIIGSAGSVVISMSAGDTADIRVFATTTLNIGVGASGTWFSGFLVSRT